MTKSTVKKLFWIFGIVAIVCHIGWLVIGFTFGPEYKTLIKTLCIIEVVTAICWWWIVAQYRDWVV